MCDYVQHFLKDRRIVLLTGMMADEDVRSYADRIAPLADEIHLCRTGTYSACDAGK